MSNNCQQSVGRWFSGFVAMVLVRTRRTNDDRKLFWLQIRCNLFKFVTGQNGPMLRLCQGSDNMFLKIVLCLNGISRRWHVKNFLAHRFLLSWHLSGAKIFTANSERGLKRGLNEYFNLFLNLRFTLDFIQTYLDRFNVIYGGKRPNVRNVFSTHGEFDPWRRVGVNQDINESSPTVILPG